MAAATGVGSIKRHFRKLFDPRVQGRTRHLLVDIVAMALCGVIADCDTWREIALFAQKRETWFKRFLNLPHGVPSHDTFERVFDRINPKTFQACFANWVAEISELVGLRHIAIDGKSLRHSFNHKAGLGMLHAVSAWAAEQHLILGQVMTDAKSNEITAIPKLLELLDLKGALVTIDAMGCQKAIAKQIVDQGGSYLLPVKANQERLLDDIQATVTKAIDGELPHETVRQCTKIESRHGRKEERTYIAIHDVEGIRDRDQWAKLTTAGMIYSECTTKGETTTDVRYFICSKRMSVHRYAKALRGHWSIENNLHWQLDVAFAEDASKIYKRNAGENFASLRRIALTLIKQNSSPESIGRKRKAAALDSDFLAEIVTGSNKQQQL
jgi:predicted transposase YbfD/YdcC